MTTVAIMQPYFFPYGGYYRLLREADIFVILDCVQFPRRGRVHRSALVEKGKWLTLPLCRAGRSALIKDIEIAAEAPLLVRRQLDRWRLAELRDTSLRRDVAARLAHPGGALAPYVGETLEIVARALGYTCKILYSSELNVPPGYRRQDRILEIARRLEARRYLNAPGGKALYQHEEFTAAGIELCFLSDYSGLLWHFLPALFAMPLNQIRSDIAAACGPGDLSGKDRAQSMEDELG